VVGTKSVNFPSNDAIKTIELRIKIKYLAMLCISANLKNIISVTEINVAITVPTPVFTPIRLRTNRNASSVVLGIMNSDIENLIGSANFSTLSITLMEKSASNEDETICACLFKLGKRLRIPLPNIAPCSKPIPKTAANVIKKFCSAKSNTFKSYPL
jgi:hypothetical protein